MKGTVKWFNEAKGFGFILGEDKKDYFVHFREINMPGHKFLSDDQYVEFQPIDSIKGKSASKVTIIEPDGNILVT